jgi:heptosyltransferase-2
LNTLDTGRSGARAIAVFLPNRIGDTVMATPALRALRLGFPEARIVVVARPNVAPVLDGSPWCDGRILIASGARHAAHRPWAARRRLRAERPDLAVLLPNSFRSALWAWWCGIPRRVGYARDVRGWLLTDRLAPPRDERGRFLPTPAVDYYLALVKHLGCPPGSPRPELFTTAAEEHAADAAWARLGLRREARVVCLNTGGAYGPAKNWPIEYFVALARRLVREFDVYVLTLCGPSERSAARAITAFAADARVMSLADQPLGIGLSKACVRRSTLMITTDSGPRHFAGAFNVPVITLFGPTHIAWTRTYHPNALHLQVPVPCGPCQRPVCPERHHRCMRELLPEAVFDAAARFLTQAEPHAA